jgi:hypothetical protein
MFFLRQESKAFWEYVNCTLATMIAFGMLVAAVSDLITEREGIDVLAWMALISVLIGTSIVVQRTTFDELVNKHPVNMELVIGSMAFVVSLIATSTFIKARIWYNSL